VVQDFLTPGEWRGDGMTAIRIAGFAKLHVGLMVLVKRMSVLINFLLNNTKLVSVLGKICPNFADHV